MNAAAEEEQEPHAGPEPHVDGKAKTSPSLRDVVAYLSVSVASVLLHHPLR